MAEKVPVLNWYAKDKLFTAGLRRFFTENKKGSFSQQSFVTMRLGPKWADKLNPGDRIAISISNNPKKPNIIGHAKVAWVKKGTIDSLTHDELFMNIGAKRVQDVWLDMQKVYNKAIEVRRDTISVLALFAAK